MADNGSNGGVSSLIISNGALVGIWVSNLIISCTFVIFCVYKVTGYA
jgi:hypothetical protein